jgi:SpoIIAA-like
MPVSYELKGSLLRLDLEGLYEPQDIIQQFLAGLSDPKCPKRVALLVDAVRSKSLEKRRPHEIRLVAESLKPYADRIGGRCAIVAEADVHFGLARMGSAYTEAIGVETEVFRNSEQALDWLGVRREK